MPRKARANPLMKIPNYRWEEYNAETGVPQICIGAIIFETIDFFGRWAWLARTVESDSWPKSRKRFGVIAASSVRYWRRGNAERSMRTFILSLGKTK